ncbi:MAG TPA: hypothetical protein PKA79_06045 [Oligoflexia bacterium]|nr:hypothetical protein [Oligoflexia bacterium]
MRENFYKPIRHWKVIFLLVFMLGCGRYHPPYAPEEVAPVAVGDLSVSATENGVKFQWSAPTKDGRGKELRQLNGYRIYRKTLTYLSDITNPRKEFELIAEIPDLFLVKLFELREQARAEGKSSHRARVPEEFKKYSYIDENLTPKISYLYKVVAFNQTGQDGGIGQLFKVDFDGLISTVILPMPVDARGAPLPVFD